MATKKVLVGVDDEVWRRVKARAAEEGRSVGLVVENALKLYLGAPVITLSPKIVPNDADPANPLDFTRFVGPGETVTTEPFTPRWEDKIGTKPKDRQFLSAVAERQAHLRDHPEDESQ